MLNHVMRGLVRRIQVCRAAIKAWMAGPSPAMMGSDSVSSVHAVNGGTNSSMVTKWI
jgi:hypothetical protein